MTIIEAINRIDAVNPNNYTQPEKVAWLSTLDGVIKKEIIDTHEGAEAVTFNGYNEETPLDTELIVPAPYDEVYLFWLQSKIDYWNYEMGKYNNSIAMYNTAYSAFEKAYNREHKPISKKLKFF
jgi:hypothetical protein